MTKYGQSLLSVAAALAISAGSLQALDTYLPLSSAANDNRWVLFGVSGIKSDGAEAAIEGEFRITDNTLNAITDPTNDNLEIVGMTMAGARPNGDDGYLGRVKAITDAGAPVEVRVDNSTVLWNETEPMRTMYIDINGDGAPNFAFTYKASLEGKVLEYAVDNGQAYETVVDYTRTFDNPVVGTLIVGADAVDGNLLNHLDETDASTIVDYDFTNNPPLSAQYSETDHRDARVAEDLRVYGYDGLNQRWDIFDIRNNLTTNDFITLTKAKGYWAKMDDGANVSDATLGEAGLVLGTPSLATADYTAAGLGDGWNLIAFDNDNTQIRNASTGLLVTFEDGVDDDFVITDSSGNHSLTVTFANTNTTAVGFAKEINAAITEAKALGTMPQTFNLRAYPYGTNGDDTVALISNKKFYIADPNDAIASVVTTLTGGPVVNPTTKADLDLSAGDLGNTAGSDVGLGVASRYGEYAVVVEPLVGAGTAQDLGATNENAAISEVIGATDTTAITNGGTVDLSAAAFDADNDIVASAIDTAMDGANDKVLLASTEPFSIRDRTFSRAYLYDDSGTASTIDITSAGANNVAALAIATGSDADTQAQVINASAASADDDGAEVIVVIANDSAASDFKVLESTADNLKYTTNVAGDLAKGAIKQVFSLGYLAKKDTNNFVTIDMDEITDTAGDTVGVNFTTTYGTAVTGTVVATADTYDETLATDADNLAVFDAVVAQLNTDLAAQGLTATASHDYDLAQADPAVEFGASVITIEGPDVIAATLDYTDAGGAAEADVAGVADKGYIGTISGDLSVDLKYNQLKAPNYVMDGPLYQMKDAGMTLKALVTGTMDFENGDVSWESIDLTRLPSEWYTSQDYDLFETDYRAGYWAYLETDATGNPLSMSTPYTSGANYSYHFDSDDGETHNLFSTNIYVEVTGISDIDNRESARVTATVGGQTVNLTRDGTTNSYVGKISTTEANGITENTDYPVVITVADGLGNRLRQEFTGVFDNVKPTVPTVSMTDGVLDISHTDGTVTGFYVFNATIPEKDTADNAVAHLTASGQVGIVCEELADVAWDTAAGGLNVVALDQTGVLGTANVSNSTSVAFMPILKDRVLITDVHDGDTEVTSIGVDYNASCTSVGAQTENTGVTLAAISADTTAKLAYTSLGEDQSHAVPVTFYVISETDGDIARITYPETYVGDSMFIQVGGIVYGVQLPSAANIEANGGESDANPYNLDTDAQNIADAKAEISL